MHPEPLTWDQRRRDPALAGQPLLDVRSPKEFRLGSVPGAVNAPLLDDEERHLIGLTYKTEGRDVATALGIERFAARAERYRDALFEALGDSPKALVHCWRGGMRSGFVAQWLHAMGVEVRVLSGGYKSYRQLALAAIARLAKHPLLVLDGRTGVGKSALLRRLADLPTIDLEALARHRGSAFGDFAQAEPVPSQQNFENQLAERYLAIEHAPRILVEIENVIGPVTLTLDLRTAIASAETVLLTRDFEDRVERLAEEYSQGWNAAQDSLFLERSQLLRKHLAKEDLERVVQATLARDFRTAVELLLKLRYDKVYDKGIARRKQSVIATFDLTAEEEKALSFLRATLDPSLRSG